MMPRDPLATRTLTRKDWGFALVLAIVMLLLGSVYMVKGVSGVFHDDGIYLSTAKALAEGQGYRLINLPKAPPQTKYPPLYPAVLALIWKFFPKFPDNLALMQWLSLLSGAAMVGLAYLYMVRFGYFSRGVAAAAGVLTLTSPFFLYFSTITLSEIPFGLLSILVLWRLERQEENPELSPKGALFLGMLLSLPVLTRSVGILFIPLGYYRLWRRGRPLLWVAGGTIALFGPWLLWVLVMPRWLVADSVTMYYTNYLMWWVSSVKPAFGQIILQNILYIAWATVAIGIGLFTTMFTPPTWTLFPVILFGVSTWLFVVKDFLKNKILPIYLVFYFLIIMVVPWLPNRFVIPILPFLIAYFLLWIKTILNKILPLRAHRLITICIVMIILIKSFIVTQDIQLNQDMNYPVFRPIKEAVAWESYQDIFRWIKDNTKPNAVIVSGLDTMIFLYTDRQAIHPFCSRPGSLFYGQNDPPLGSWDEVLQFMKRYRAQFIAQVPMPGFAEEEPFKAILEQLIEKCPDLLQPVHIGSDSRFVIYQIFWDKMPLEPGDMPRNDNS